MTSWPSARRCIISSAPALGTLLAGCASTPPTQPASSPLEELAWLAGSWRSVSEGGATTEEHWTPPAGGSMLGMGRSLRPAGGDPEGPLATASYEFLRISAEPGGGVVYFAAPQGRHPATPFTLERTGGPDDRRRLVFTNPAHDFPQRIVYEALGPHRALVTISTIDTPEERSMSWTMRRVEPARIISAHTWDADRGTAPR